MLCAPHRWIVSAPQRNRVISRPECLCETWCTVLFNLWDQARLLPKRKGTDPRPAPRGVGIAAIQLARLLGAHDCISPAETKKNCVIVSIGVHRAAH